MPNWNEIRNEAYNSNYRRKPGMFESRRDMAKTVIPALCGLGGWAMVGLLIYWAVRG